MAHRKKRGTSGQWASRQNRDPYIKKARHCGFRARSVFKLEQIDRKYGLLKPDSTIIDLGSAPGSWAQYAAAIVHTDQQIVAVDCLAMQDIEKVRFIHGDFTQSEVIEQIITALDGRAVDVVLSDMAPNLSGIRSTDQARAATLQQAIMEFCQHSLKSGGRLLSKLFAGEDVATTRKQFSDCFAHTRTVKPPASRAHSKEIYLLAMGYRGRDNP